MSERGTFERKKSKDISKYFFWTFLLFLIVFSYFILRDYLIALISAFILAYLVRPVYLRIESKTRKELAALLSIFLILAVVILPFWLVLNTLIKQIILYSSAGFFSSFLEKLFSYPLVETFIQNESFLEKLSSWAGGVLSSIVLSIPRFLISIFIALFAIYYLLIDWERISYNLKKSIPLRHKEETVKEISEITNIMIYGTLFVGLIEFAVAAVGFYILGVNFYLLLAGLIFLFAFIPGLGPMIVWIPLMIFYFIRGDYFSAVGILIVGIILSAGIDIVFRARLIGKKSKINPLIVFLGILGGVPIFGFFGFIIGPLILAYTTEILGEVLD